MTLFAWRVFIFFAGFIWTLRVPPLYNNIYALLLIWAKIRAPSPPQTLALDHLLADHLAVLLIMRL